MKTSPGSTAEKSSEHGGDEKETRANPDQHLIGSQYQYLAFLLHFYCYNVLYR